MGVVPLLEDAESMLRAIIDSSTFTLAPWEARFCTSLAFQIKVWKEARIGFPVSLAQMDSLGMIHTRLARETLELVRRRGPL